MMEKLPAFDFSNPAIDPHELTIKLVETLQGASNRGVYSVNASEIGLPYRVFVMSGQPPVACFNPRIVDESNEHIVLEESCYSNPNLFIKIKRPKFIKVRYQDMDGIVHTEKFIGMTARAFQHELDHLNGLSYTRRANPLHLQRALNKKKQIDRALAKQAK
jgi:peptide deformylase